MQKFKKKFLGEKSGACPFYEVGAEYFFERYGDADTATQNKIAAEIKNLDGVHNVNFRADKNFTEIFMDRNNEVADEKVLDAVKIFGSFETRID